MIGARALKEYLETLEKTGRLTESMSIQIDGLPVETIFTIEGENGERILKLESKNWKNLLQMRVEMIGSLSREWGISWTEAEAEVKKMFSISLMDF